MRIKNDLIVSEKLGSFPLQLVRKASDCYNKAFHAKIFTLFASSESEVFTFSKLHPVHYNYCFAFMHDDQGQWYLENEGIERVRSDVLSQAKKDASRIQDIFGLWESEWKKYISLCRSISKRRLAGYDKKQIIEVFTSFYLQYLKVGSVAYIADSFMSTGTEDWLEVLLAQELKDKVEIKERKEIIHKLTSPVHLSFVLESEYRLLKVGLYIQKKYGKLPSYDELLSDKRAFGLLQKIESDFHWIRNNYYNVKKIGAKEFYAQLIELVKNEKKDSFSIKEQLLEKRKDLENIREERQQLMDTLGMSKYSLNLLKIASLFAKWKDKRKSGVYIGMYYFDMFMTELAARTGYTKQDLNFLVFDELIDLLENDKDYHRTIDQRKERCFFAVTDAGYFIAQGKDAIRYFDISAKKRQENIAILQGVVASSGFVRGTVKIINKTSDMHEFKEGEILVTNQTTPDFVPVMRKAAAIITEQGGITSHAAIVSRELKKPCIIGTKIATKVLLDGELVEVDAINGKVTRLR